MQDERRARTQVSKAKELTNGAINALVLLDRSKGR